MSTTPEQPGRQHDAASTAPSPPPGPAAKSSGPGRLLVAVYALFSLAAGCRALIQLIFRFDEAPVSFILSGVAAAIYVVATIALAKTSLRAYWVSVWTVGIELAGVLAVGVLSLAAPELFPKASVWSHFGSGYGYVPLVLPVIGLLWLRRNRPSTRRG
ncbi:hypothetical protein [Rothia kristinae]|uniref:hypothetical protein n=1 Tax=Rothia kristinae TaxID=37923 RepID=UPI000A828B42|nr:hypothetical protein [Rothia kristinae]MED6046291.1 hypothetical protein [Rothia kristinae]TDP56225.1 hypothetical protein DEU33_1110 [Kocuria sp. AG109]WGH08837.1 hypothetical protein OU799_07660 [Rothia kristinae]